MKNEVEANTLEQKQLMSRRAFIRRMAWLGVGAAGGSTLVWSAKFEPEWMEIKRVTLRLPQLSPAFNGITIAQISDLHLSSWMTHERAHNIMQRVNELKPDLIALTGDFVSRRQNEHEGVLREVLSTLKSREGAFAVMGNHDHWSNVAPLRRAIAKSGVQELQNSFHTLRRDGEVLHICGVDDGWAAQADVEKVLRQLPKRGAAILLAHEPDFADDYAKANRFDLQLSGHTHGGQVRLPFIGPTILPAYGQKYHTAQYTIRAQRPLTLYVNRGVGMVRPYVRLNCRPEITLFTLRSV